jgi:hypothetical protein
MMTWLKRVLIALAIAATAIQWVNTRTEILLVNQNPAHPLILATYPIFHSMATGMREGRIGQVDLAALQRYSSLHDLSAPYERLPRDATHEWVNYYTLDVGYSFIVEAARLAFPGLPDNYLRPLALQFVADAALVLFVFFVFSHWNLWVGLLAAFLYSSNFAFTSLVSFAYYYYWDIPLTLLVLGSLVLAYRRPEETTRWLTLAGLALGFGVWVRGSWWPLSLFLLVVAGMSPVLRKKLLVPVMAFAILATPQVVRSSLARGRLTLSTRAIWHVAMVGLGYYPNPYGLTLHDEVIFKLTQDKYGVPFRSEDYYAHDQAAKKEFLSIWDKDRRFVIRSFWGRLKVSILGRTESSVPSFLFFPNLTYRVVCLAGFVAMILRGGEKRLLAVASLGTYVIYVVMTSAFFYVGLAYSNVSEVALFVLFVGGIEAGLHAARRIVDGDYERVGAGG